MRENYLFVIRCDDGSYYAEEGKGMGDHNFTFDRNDIKYFNDEYKAQKVADNINDLLGNKEFYVSVTERGV